MSYSCLKKGDARRTILIADWEKWMKSADRLYGRYIERFDNESPFAYHEVSCVGLLSNAAAIAGFLPMLEYDLKKISGADRRRRVKGRADLWFEADRRCYSLEVKKAPINFTAGGLQKRLDKANADIARIQDGECHAAAGCLIAVANDAAEIGRCDDFARSEHVDIAYKIGPAASPAFLFFKVRT